MESEGRIVREVGRPDSFEFEAEVVKETIKGVCVYSSEYGELWLPVSVTEVDDEEGTVRIPLWLAEKKGFTG